MTSSKKKKKNCVYVWSEAHWQWNEFLNLKLNLFRFSAESLFVWFKMSSMSVDLWLSIYGLMLMYLIVLFDISRLRLRLINFKWKSGMRVLKLLGVFIWSIRAFNRRFGISRANHLWFSLKLLVILRVGHWNEHK